ncbi:MAG: type II toxin-antitoxin system HicB family antitoxin [Methanomicrobiales archaeon]|nr:type II toxin-antitoxin system HicB family antitoxin [Methanomicrobiales archaeon]MDI6877302.1 type II toxin-antitoxin system HicB family antitoxin [Methanomicrobiales archaeon]
MRRLNYRILLRKEPERGYTVTVPTLPGCVTFGETVEEAIAMAKEAIELYIEDLQEKGEDIPTEEGLREYTLTVEPRENVRVKVILDSAISRRTQGILKGMPVEEIISDIENRGVF